MDRQTRTVASTCLPSTVTARNGEGNAPASLAWPQGKAEAGQLENLFGMVRVLRAKIRGSGNAIDIAARVAGDHALLR